MAFVYSLIAETIWGNKRVQLGFITPDSAEGTVNLGSKRIEHVLLTYKSGTASGSSQAAPRVGYNVGSTSTASTGTLALSLCVAANIYSVQVVFGEA
mgnify:CR=1 FL=1